LCVFKNCSFIYNFSGTFNSPSGSQQVISCAARTENSCSVLIKLLYFGHIYTPFPKCVCVYVCVFVYMHACPRINKDSVGGRLVAQLVGRPPWAQVMILDSRDRVPHRSPCSAGNLLLPLTYPLLYSFSVSQMNKKKKKKKG